MDRWTRQNTLVFVYGNDIDFFGAPDPFHAYVILASDSDQSDGSATARVHRMSGDGPSLEFVAAPGTPADATAKALSALKALHPDLTVETDDL